MEYLNIVVKHVLLIIIVLSSIIISNTSTSEANSKYLNDNHNYPLIFVQQGSFVFLDKTSLYVEKYAPPDYALVANIIIAPTFGRDGRMDNLITKKIHFFYYFDKSMNDREMYEIDESKNKVLISNTNRATYNMCSIAIGEAMFYVYYRIRFYGDISIYNNYTKLRESIMANGFYDNL